MHPGTIAGLGASLVSTSVAAISVAMSPAPSVTNAAPPAAWYTEHIASLTADGGMWLADNTVYRSANEPFEAYGLRWQRGVGAHSLRGELLGIDRGQRSAPFFEYRVYWHPGRNVAVVIQLGAGGMIGEGELRQSGDGIELVQQFWNPDGTTRRERHVERQDDNVRTSTAYTWEAERWEAGRTYRWVRQPAK